MKCKTCGYEFPDDRQYCPLCGTRAGEADISWNTYDFPKPKQFKDISMHWPDYDTMAADKRRLNEPVDFSALNRSSVSAEKRAAEEAARKEAQRLAAEEAARKEAQRLAAEEAARKEAQRLAAEGAARREAERLAAEEAARKEAQLAAEAAALPSWHMPDYYKGNEKYYTLSTDPEVIRRVAAAQASKAAARQAAAEEAARVEAARKEAERLAAEEAARREAERLAAEEAARVEAERLAAEEAARAEAALKDAEEAAKAEAARREAERMAAEEAARKEAERLLAESAARQAAARIAAEQAAEAEAAKRAAEAEAAAEAARLAEQNFDLEDLDTALNEAIVSEDGDVPADLDWLSSQFSYNGLGEYIKQMQTERMTLAAQGEELVPEMPAEPAEEMPAEPAPAELLTGEPLFIAPVGEAAAAAEPAEAPPEPAPSAADEMEALRNTLPFISILPGAVAAARTEGPSESSDEYNDALLRELLEQYRQEHARPADPGADIESAEEQPAESVLPEQPAEPESASAGSVLIELSAEGPAEEQPAEPVFTEPVSEVSAMEEPETFTVEDLLSEAAAEEPGSAPAGSERRPEQFFTFYKKNEEFQALLDQEYERMRRMQAGAPNFDNTKTYSLPSGKAKAAAAATAAAVTAAAAETAANVVEPEDSPFEEVSRSMGKQAFTRNTVEMKVAEMKAKEAAAEKHRSDRKRRLEEMAKAREAYFSDQAGSAPKTPKQPGPAAQPEDELDMVEFFKKERAAEAERQAALQREEAERLAQQQRREEELRAAEAQRQAELQREEEERLAQQQRREEELRAAEAQRQAELQREEEERLAQQQRLEEELRAAEAQRQAELQKAEEERLARQKAEEEFLAQQQREEEERNAAALAAEAEIRRAQQEAARIREAEEEERRIRLEELAGKQTEIAKANEKKEETDAGLAAAAAAAAIAAAALTEEDKLQERLEQIRIQDQPESPEAGTEDKPEAAVSFLRPDENVSVLNEDDEEIDLIKLFELQQAAETVNQTAENQQPSAGEDAGQSEAPAADQPADAPAEEDVKIHTRKQPEQTAAKKPAAKRRKRKQSRPVAGFLVALLLILCIFEAVCAAAARFAPETEFTNTVTQFNQALIDAGLEGADKVKDGAESLMERIRGGKDAESDVPEDGVDLAAIADACGKNIKHVARSSQLVYDPQARYSVEGLGDLPVCEDAAVKTAVYSTMVGYNSSWIDYVNNGDTACLNYLKADRSAYRSAVAYDKLGTVEESFKTLELGEIRLFDGGAYVFVREAITVKENGNTAASDCKLVYKLEKVGEEYKIAEYSMIQ